MTRSQQKTQQSRRKLLAALSIGAAAKLPELWAKPTVASVMLPAHAAGTGTQCEFAQLTVVSTSEPNGSRTITLLGAAYGLPSGPIYYGLFSYYQNNSILAGLTNAYPGTHTASVTITVAQSALCSNLALDVFQQGNLTERLCHDNTVACSVTF